MKNPKRELEDFRRFEEVLTILTEEGFKYILDRLKVSEHVPLTKRVMNRKRETRPERLREMIERLGTTYIKLGQILAERPDMVPEKYIEELKKLQDSAPEFDQEEAREIVEEEVGMENFQEFSDEPIAAASIAQVHKARLESGDDVIVKIRRPGVKQQVRNDLDILNFLAEKAEQHLSSMKKVDALNFVQEFSKWTRQELDMEQECLNAQIFRENMKSLEGVKVPRVYPELTTEKVLVMEYVEGVKCTEDEKLKQLDINQEQIAKNAIRAGLRQTVLDGFFHADPHPSNFLINEEGKIIYLDFGMMGKITTDKSEKLALIILYLIRQDVDSIVDVLEEVGTTTEDYDRDSAEQIAEEKVLILRNSNISQHSITKEMFDMFVEMSGYGLKMPPNLALMGKGLVTMEGIGLTIYPDFQITKEYEKMVENVLKEKNSPKDMGKDFAIDLLKNKELFTKLPTKLNEKIEDKPRNTVTKIPEIDIRLMPTALTVSSTGLIAASVFDRVFLYIGLLELVYAIHLHRSG